MRSLSGCSRYFFRVLLFLYASVLFFLLLVDRTTRHRATRHLEALVLTRQSRAVRFERLYFGYYCSAANSMFARLGMDYEIRNQWFFATLEVMTTD